MPVNEPHTAREHADFLIERLEDTLGLALPKKKEKAAAATNSLLAHIARVGQSNFEDLSSWVLLECLEMHRRGQEVEWADVLRAADRIQHRINRQRARERTSANADIAVDTAAAADPSMIDLKLVLKELPHTDLLVFHWFYLEGMTVAHIGEKLNISRAGVYRRLRALKEMLTNRLR